MKFYFLLFILLNIFSTKILAEPPIHLDLGEIFKGIFHGTFNNLNTPKPIKIFNACSHETNDCLLSYADKHPFNKNDNRKKREKILGQVTDSCWKKSSNCPVNCKQRYFELRQSGLTAFEAEDKVLFLDNPSCISGYSKLVHPSSAK